MACSIAHSSIDHLIITIDRIRIPIRIARDLINSTHSFDIIGSTHSLIIHHIRIRIRHIHALGPIGFYRNTRHALRHIPVGTLIEHTTTDAIQVFVGTFTISEVIRCREGDISVLINTRCGITTPTEASRSARDGCNLPTCHHTVFSVVACTHIIIVRQLHLAVVEVEALIVLVSDGQRETTSGNACTRWSTIHSTATDATNRNS